MKNTLLILILTVFSLNTSWAINHCEEAEWEKKYICVIAGGTANTDQAINMAHSRSLSLKTARLLAYEKMAEKIKGVIVGSQSNLKNEIIDTSSVKSIVTAVVRNVNFEKETVRFLADGSPWAEVTLSVPLYGPEGVENEVLEYQHGQSLKKNNETIPSKNVIIALDLRGNSETLKRMPSIKNRTDGSLFYSPSMNSQTQSMGRFNSLKEVYEANPKYEIKVMSAEIEDGDIFIGEKEIKSIKVWDAELDLFKNQKVVLVLEK